MPTHTVSAAIQLHSLSKSGTSISFDVFTEEDSKLGRLVVGRGSLTWYPKKHKNGKKLTWTQFAALFDGK